MPYCKVCGYQLGDPQGDLHDPEGLSDVAQDQFQGGNEADDPHLVVRDGEKGWRYYCTDTGMTTSIVTEPPSPEGEGPPPNGDSESEPKDQRGEVFEIKEDKSPIEVLQDVVTRPFLGLNEAQVDEVKDWAEDYDGQIPPDMLEDILKNMSGIQKQSAQLARQKYEVKLNRWVQQQSNNDTGPPIGITSRPPSSSSHRGRASRQQYAQQEYEGHPEDESERETGTDRGTSSRSIGDPTDPVHRRKRRVARRQDVIDEAALEFADKFVGEMAKEAGTLIGDVRKIASTVFKRKAEKDPDWFIEKAEQWDLDMLDVMLEPSESRKREIRERGKPEADSRVEDALEDITSEREVEEQQSESVNRGEREPDVGGAFEDLKGDVDESEQLLDEDTRGPFEDIEQHKGE